MTWLLLTEASSLSGSRTSCNWVSSPEMDVRPERASRQPRMKAVTSSEVLITAPSSEMQAVVMESGSIRSVSQTKALGCVSSVSGSEEPRG